MLKPSLLLLFSFLGTALFAQSTPFDTILWNDLKRLSKSNPGACYQKAGSVYNEGVATQNEQKKLIGQFYRGSILIMAQQFQLAYNDLDTVYRYASTHDFPQAARAQVAYNFAECNMMLNNYGRGRELMQESISLSTDAVQKAVNQIGWGALLSRIGQRDEAFSTMMTSLEVLKNIPEKKDVVAQCYANLAAICQEVDDERTETFCQWSLDASQAFYQNDPNPIAAPVYYTWGIWRQKQNNYSGSVEALQEAIRYWTAMAGTEETPPIASCYSYIGIARAKEGRMNEAIEAVNKAIKIRAGSLLDDLDPVSFYIEAIDYYLQTGDMKQAKLYSDTTLSLVNQIKAVHPDPNDFALRSSELGAYTSRINLYLREWEMSRDMQSLRTALEEAPKVTALFDSLQNNIFNPSIDDTSLIELASDAYRYIEPLVELYYLADSLKLEPGGLARAYQLAEGLKSLGLLKKQLKEVADRGNIGNYTSFNVADTQNRLLTRPDDALLQYFVGQRHVYIFLLTPNSVVLKRVSDGPKITALSRQLIVGINGYYAHPDSFENKSNAYRQKELKKYNQYYLSSAQQLYDLLIRPIEAMIPDKARLAIIPDDRLGYIPFEALLRSNDRIQSDLPDFSQLDYFIRGKVIYYGWSARSLYRMRSEKKDGPQCTSYRSFVAYTPFSMNHYYDNNRYSLNRLTSTTSVAGLAAQLFDASKEWNDAPAATVSRFMEGPCARYMYVGTHGMARNQRFGSCIYLNPADERSRYSDSLTIDKIFKLNFNQTDHVLLEACSSGLGLLKPGDGIMSIAWAFASAGAKSVSSTLWNTNAYASGEMSKIFYGEIAKTSDAAHALSAAKHNMIARKDDGLTNYPHPFYWGSMVLSGNTVP